MYIFITLVFKMKINPQNTIFSHLEGSLYMFVLSKFTSLVRMFDLPGD